MNDDTHELVNLVEFKFKFKFRSNIVNSLINGQSYLN